MARTIAFDETQALDRAMLLFWEQGYEATTVRDLTTATGLSTSSLYNTFGDKRELFLAALQHYRQDERRQFAGILSAPGPLRGTLAGLFAELIETLVADDGLKGSFTLNAAIELGGRDPDVTALLRDHFDDLCDMLADRLSEARLWGELAGEIVRRHDPADLARYILFGLYSMATMVKVYNDRARMDKMAEIILATLD
ncbi:MAG: TetR/AcrR family transcriptional regulator [Anaerolineae bacterium]|nr:TetR/AcrR family transcriptional regulator [Anaerolineae bacterium]